MNEGSMRRFKRINTKERRSARRIRASESIPHTITRLASGQKVELINISLDGGILINSAKMLVPGSFIRLRMAFPDALLILEGHVVRCRVIGLKQSKIQYEAGIILNEGLPSILAEKIQLTDTEKAAATESSQETDPNPMPLPDTAELWVLNAQGA